MGKTGLMGAFEELVLLALARLGADAFAVSIRREIEQRCGNDVAMGAVYATIDRLEAKGLVAPAPAPAPDRPSRPGRPRRYYAITAAGVEALRRTRSVRAAMWDDVDLAALEVGGSA